LLADESGNVIASAVAGPSNPNVVKENELANVFDELFSSLKQKYEDLQQNVSFLYAGISGAGNKENEKIIREILKEHFSEHTAIEVEGDAVNALYAGTYGKPGIVQISGTGSITYGKNSQGKAGRVGGWGYLFGDEGSGYDMGRQAVIAALKAYDGRGVKTVLLNILFKHFQAENPQALIRNIYTSESPKIKISPLAQIVFDAYKQNDSAAREIINQTAKDLALSIATLYKKLFPSGEHTTVVLSGGIFQEKEILPALLQQELSIYSNLTLAIPKMSPAGGALIGACLMKQNQVEEEIIKNIIHTE
jgi:N-acetylglucosamine kinase-like BadF-type ATPase